MHPLVTSLLTEQSPDLRSLAVQLAEVFLSIPTFYEVSEKTLLAEHLANILLTEGHSVVRYERLKYSHLCFLE